MWKRQRNMWEWGSSACKAPTLSTESVHSSPIPETSVHLGRSPSKESLHFVSEAPESYLSLALPGRAVCWACI